MFNIRNYVEANSVDEALEFLAGHPAAKVIAGGTDVLVKLHGGKLKEAELLGIRGIGELRRIERQADGALRVGPMATFSSIAADPLLEKYIPILGEAAISMGGPQIRNVATVGGNVCNGATSADSAPALFALNARLTLRSAAGERTVPIQEFYRGPGQVDLRAGELLTGIVILPEDYEGYFGRYIKFAMRKAMDIATLGVAALCRVEAGDTLRGVRIGLGVAAPTPVRCPEAEAFAEGKGITEEDLAQIGAEAVKSARARTSWRASLEYREHLVRELVPRALQTAIRRAGGEKDAE